MGNETDVAGIIKRKRVASHEGFAVDVDSRGRYFFYAPDGMQQDGMKPDQMRALRHLVQMAVNFHMRVQLGSEELPK
jgi:hypothetical protein